MWHRILQTKNYCLDQVQTISWFKTKPNVRKFKLVKCMINRQITKQGCPIILKRIFSIRFRHLFSDPVSWFARLLFQSIKILCKALVIWNFFPITTKNFWSKNDTFKIVFFCSNISLFHFFQEIISQIFLFNK